MVAELTKAFCVKPKCSSFDSRTRQRLMRLRARRSRDLANGFFERSLYDVHPNGFASWSLSFS